MTKSYVVGLLAAFFTLTMVMTNASAMGQVANSTAEPEVEAAQDKEPEHNGLPLFPLLEPESNTTSAQPVNTQEASPVVKDNLVELAEHQLGPREFVIFVVRHMEKEDSTLDPGLTADGVRRADGLAQLLSSADIERIYSTLYRRSAGTALPLARKLAIPVEFYQPDAGDELVASLLDAGQSALVVGHSNTVANLVSALGGSTGALSEEQYGDIFQLLIRIDGDDHDVRQLHLKAPLIATERRGSR